VKELNFGHKPDLNSYTHNIDPDVLGLYAKENCKHCYGRGYTIVDIGDGKNTTIRGDKIQTILNRCSCTAAAMKKYG